MDTSRYLNIQVGGKNRELFFGNNTLEKFMEVEGIKYFSEIAKGFQSVTLIRSIIYAGCVVADRKAKREIDYDLEDVSDWLDDFPQGNTKKVMEKFTAMVQKLGEMMGEMEGIETPQTKAPKKSAGKK